MRTLCLLALVACTGPTPEPPTPPPAPPAPPPACPPDRPGASLELPPAPVEGAVWAVDYGAGIAEPPWQALKAAGVEGVYLKASKATVVEADFGSWWVHAKACGLKRGAFHFVCPTNAPDGESCPKSELSSDPAAYGQAQGQTLLKALGDDLGEWPPVLDVESSAHFDAAYQADNLALVQAAATAIRSKTQLRPILYGGTITFSKTVCSGPSAGCCEGDWDPVRFWQAEYSATPPTLTGCWAEQSWSLWQYHAGAEGQPDMDVIGKGLLP